jgi:hypothetical protein
MEHISEFILSIYLRLSQPSKIRVILPLSQEKNGAGSVTGQFAL